MRSRVVSIWLIAEIMHYMFNACTIALWNWKWNLTLSKFVKLTRTKFVFFGIKKYFYEVNLLAVFIFNYKLVVQWPRWLRRRHFFMFGNNVKQKLICVIMDTFTEYSCLIDIYNSLLYKFFYLFFPFPHWVKCLFWNISWTRGRFPNLIL